MRFRIDAYLAYIFFFSPRLLGWIDGNCWCCFEMRTPFFFLLECVLVFIPSRTMNKPNVHDRNARMTHIVPWPVKYKSLPCVKQCFDWWIGRRLEIWWYRNILWINTINDPVKCTLEQFSFQICITVLLSYWISEKSKLLWSWCVPLWQPHLTISHS